MTKKHLSFICKKTNRNETMIVAFGKKNEIPLFFSNVL